METLTLQLPVFDEDFAKTNRVAAEFNALTQILALFSMPGMTTERKESFLQRVEKEFLSRD